MIQWKNFEKHPQLASSPAASAGHSKQLGWRGTMGRSGVAPQWWQKDGARLHSFSYIHILGNYHTYQKNKQYSLNILFLKIFLNKFHHVFLYWTFIMGQSSVFDKT
jgi:hypothetical protein